MLAGTALTTSALALPTLRVIDVTQSRAAQLAVGASGAASLRISL